MKKATREQWIEDVSSRQRNLVFPDTAENEARFCRNLYQGTQRLTLLQSSGIVVMVLLAIFLVISITVGWGHEGSSWVKTVFSAALDWLIAAAIRGGFLLLLRWGTRKLL
jgi:hypothetical protein